MAALQPEQQEDGEADARNDEHVVLRRGPEADEVSECEACVVAEASEHFVSPSE